MTAQQSVGWNYRILFDGETHSVGEVYYNPDGTPAAYTEGGVLDEWEELADLVATYEMVGAAMRKPALRVDPETETILGEMGVLQ